MNRLFRRFWPPFFEKLDHWLLLHHPNLWATRIHGLVLALSGFAAFIGARVLMTSYQHVPNVEADFTIIVIVSVLIWLGWMASMYAFRPGKYQSEHSRGGQYSLVLMLGTILVAIMPVLFGMGISSKLDLKNNSGYWQEEKVLRFGASYWTYDSQSLENSTYTYKRNRNSSAFGSGQSELEKLEMAMQLMEKYGGDFRGVTSQQLLEAHRHAIAMPQDFQYDIEKAFENIRHRRDAGYLFDDFHELPAFKSEVTHIFIFVFMLIGMLTVIFQHASMRQFVWALVAFGGISIAIGVLALLNELSRFTRDTELISFLMLGSYILTAMLAFGGKHRVKKMQKTALILLGLALPFLGLVLVFFGTEVLDVSLRRDWDMLDGYWGPFVLAVIPAILSLVLWITLFIPRLQKLQTAPPRK